tara:strand:- start:1766 stop:2221 length:456 start_codon:yes stop_codon:yes gene_type:complete
MKVILLENIRKIGTIGQIVNVKRGFARNYLFSKKKALFASKENIKEVEKIKNDLNKKDFERKKSAQKIFELINNATLTFKKLATEKEELYGSVKPSEICEEIEIQKKIKIEPSLIQLNKEIKKLGKFKVKVDLHSELQAELSIIVKAEENK